jgi:hypothetical protein
LETAVETEVIDFTYVQVTDTDADEVDIVIPGVGDHAAQNERAKRDILSFLLTRDSETDHIASTLEEANSLVERARQAKKDDRYQDALDCHTEAAKLFYQAASLLKDCYGKYKCRNQAKLRAW